MHMTWRSLAQDLDGGGGRRSSTGDAEPITHTMGERLDIVYPLHRRLLRTLNFPGVIWEFRRRGDSWSRARYHTHLWVWGFIRSPSEAGRDTSRRPTGRVIGR